MFTIAEWRRLKNISQEEMASKLGVHFNTYRAWEKKPSSIKLEYAEKICKIFDCTIVEIKFLP